VTSVGKPRARTGPPLLASVEPGMLVLADRGFAGAGVHEEQFLLDTHRGMTGHV
jgi:hypothetical protein